MVNINELKAEMLRQGVTNQKMQDTLHLTKDSWFRRLSGKTDFTPTELALIVKELKLDKDKAFDIMLSEREV